MDKQYNPESVEKKIYDFWEKNNFFIPDETKKGISQKTFSIVIPPPNVTGSLHMGHALNATIQDILCRWKRMQGFKTLWVPGTDHAGIATQNVVEKKLKKEGKTRFDLGREKFIEEVWKWKEEYGGRILGQLKKLGASCDWSRTRFTMDENYTEAVHSTFLHYVKNGWVYRGERVVNWCPRCQTSLSDLELEYKEEQGGLWFIKYPLADDDADFIVVATTRPETMFGDTAVAVNSKDNRYSEFVGRKIKLPLTDREIPIIADSVIDVEFGTGAVKVTPAHDMEDYLIGQRHQLEMLAVINGKGRMENVPIGYQGLKVAEARERVLADLQSRNLIVKKEDYTHKIPKCYRCSATIELIPSLQWFVKMNDLAKKAIDPVIEGKIKFYPKRWEKAYIDWLGQARDWCISRQIWWGHRLPVWFCEKESDKYFISIKKPAKCEICNNCEPRQSEDVFDTWFSSALWPFAVMGWPKQTKDSMSFYPTNILSTARDIINLWVARMVFSAVELTGCVPFTDVIIHATVTTKDGKRMSKSLGTGIDPIEMVKKYGADSTRFGLSWQASESQDMRFGEGDIMAGKKFCNKIWNASRFVFQMIEGAEVISKDEPKPATMEDQLILSAFRKVSVNINESLCCFRFDQAIQEIYHFFWHQFCDIYIEKAKSQMKEPEISKNTKLVLAYILLGSLKILHPFMPFITEEIYQMFPIRSKEAIIIEDWPI